MYCRSNHGSVWERYCQSASGSTSRWSSLLGNSEIQRQYQRNLWRMGRRWTRSSRYRFLYLISLRPYEKYINGDRPLLGEGAGLESVNGMKNEPMVTTKCPEITSVAPRCKMNSTAGDVNGQKTKWTYLEELVRLRMVRSRTRRSFEGALFEIRTQKAQFEQLILNLKNIYIKIWARAV